MPYHGLLDPAETFLEYFYAPAQVNIYARAVQYMLCTRPPGRHTYFNPSFGLTLSTGALDGV